MQLLLLVAFMALAAGLWLNRDKVGEAAAALYGTDTDTDQQSQSGGPDNTGVPVIVAEVAIGRNDEVISAVGTARARRSIIIHPETDGVIVDFAPKAGEHVERGDVIAKLDSDQAELDVQLARQRLEETRRTVARARFLEEKSVNSSAQVEDARTTEARASVELLKAEETLRDLVIRAPFSGVVGIPSVEIGERVTTTTPLISLDQRNDILVEFEVAEEFLSRIAVGIGVEGQTPGYANRTFEGSIENIDSRVDTVSRTVKLRAAIPNPDDELRPGMSFVINVNLPGGEYPVVAELALQWRKGESFVWTIVDGKASRVVVDVVSRLNSTILVDGDIGPGDVVVVEGVQRLRPGRAVNITTMSRDQPGEPQG